MTPAIINVDYLSFLVIQVINMNQEMPVVQVLIVILNVPMISLCCLNGNVIPVGIQDRLSVSGVTRSMIVKAFATGAITAPI